MNNLILDKYLDIVNVEKLKRGLDNYVPLYPMLRVVDCKLFVVVMLVEESDRVWDFDGNVKARYWALINPETDEIVEFNGVAEKDFVIGEIIKKHKGNKQKEILKYKVDKTLQYK